MESVYVYSYCYIRIALATDYNYTMHDVAIYSYVYTSRTACPSNIYRRSIIYSYSHLIYTHIRRYVHGCMGVHGIAIGRGRICQNS